MRRILQDSGAEVVHIGHNRSAGEIVNAAIQEDAQGIAVSSYQGGHIEFFKYIVDLLKENDACHIKVFGGGGGVIIPSEIRQLHDYGVARIYSPEDGSNMGLQGPFFLARFGIYSLLHSISSRPSTSFNQGHRFHLNPHLLSRR